MLHNDPSSLVRFSDFSEEFTQTNCGAPLKIDRPTLLKRNMTSSTEETGRFGSSTKTHKHRPMIRPQ